jgi:DNA polymerase-1
MRPLLVIDGDSFAHRAYHAIPKTIQRTGGAGNALYGFGTMLMRLWQGERPRTVLVAWDTLEEPTYRHRALAAYQAGREFEKELLEQLALLPALVASTGLAYAKAPGYEADDFLGAAVGSEEAKGGAVLVATSDRDAFQLASQQTTILQPVRGEAPARVGPAEVRERYGVDPQQVPDFIALRGDPSDRIPGARGIGPKKAAELLAQYGSLEAMLAEGRFAAEADALRLFREIATLDRAAPLPELPDVEPDWGAGALHARELGMAGLASRFEEAASST